MKTITFYTKDNELISSENFYTEKYVMQDGSLNEEQIKLFTDKGITMFTTPEGTHRVEVK